MISHGIITKPQLIKVLKGLNLFGPVKKEEMVLFEKIEDPSSICWDFHNSLRAPKELFLPMRDVIFTYDNKILRMVELADEKRVILNIRPCDAKGLLLLDRVFIEDTPDPYYATRRENSILFGLACNEPLSTCFCTSFDAQGPHSTEGLDLLLTCIGDETFFVEVISQKAMNLIGKQIKRPETVHFRAKDESRTRATERIKRVLKVPQDMDKLFDSRYWQDTSRGCITCGICRYLCSTCHCFDIIDEDKERVKTYSSCSFLLFTKEAAGTNPRQEKAARFKQWFYHKFDYFKKNYGEYLCSGCGRCIRYCPVRVDHQNVLKDLKPL